MLLRDVTIRDDAQVKAGEKGPIRARFAFVRAVRGQLILRWLDAHKTLVIVSPGRKEGRSWMAASVDGGATYQWHSTTDLFGAPYNWLIRVIWDATAS